MLLTTGPNDVSLKRAARELTEEHKAKGLFEVEFHGWDWIEGKLVQKADIAVSYGLIALAYQLRSQAEVSPIAVATGQRLVKAIDIMNAKRDADNQFTLQQISKHLGHDNWYRIEQIAAGVAVVETNEITTIANLIGMSPKWLIEGKGNPFAPDVELSSTGVESLYDAIAAMRPDRVVFMRQLKRSESHHNALICVKVNDIKWTVFPDMIVTSDPVGSGGATQILDLCRLIRRLEWYGGEQPAIPCYGCHIGNEEFEKIYTGEVYPGTFLNIISNDYWHQDLACLRDDLVKSSKPHFVALRNAIDIARDRLVQFRHYAQESEAWSTRLEWGRFSQDS